MRKRIGIGLRGRKRQGRDFALGFPPEWSGAYTRASTATRVASDGIVRFVPHNLWKNKTWANGATASGASPPTITANQTVDGVLCTKIEFPAGVAGWGGSRAQQIGVSNNVPVVIGHTYQALFHVFLSRPLSPSESIAMLVTGDFSYLYKEITSSTVATSWVVVSTTAIVAGSNGNVYPNLFVENALSSPITVYVARGMLTMGAAAPGDWVAGVDDTNQYFGSAPLDHNPATLEPLGITVEGQRVQLAASTAALSAAPWSNDGTAPTITENYATGPDGTLSADRVQFPAAVSGRRQAATIASGTAYTISGWVRSNAGTGKFRLTGQDFAKLSADLTATTQWQRVEYTYTATASGAYSWGLYTSAGSDAADLIVWGLGHEAGAFATSYIPNPATSGTVTRAAASLILTGSTLSAEIGTGATGTITASVYVPPLGSSDTGYVWELSNADRSTRIGVWIDGATMTARIGVGAASVSLGAVTVGALATIEASWGTTGMSARLNGGTVYESAATFDGTTCTKLAVCSTTAPASQLSRAIRRWHAMRDYSLLALPA